VPSPEFVKMKTDTRVRLLHALAVLHSLRDVEFVGSTIETIVLALHENDGMTCQDVDRACLFARRWHALSARLRAFYASALVSTRSTRRSAVGALWRVLNASRAPVSGAVYGALRQEWIRVHGYAPPLELVPIQKEDTK